MGSFRSLPTSGKSRLQIGGLLTLVVVSGCNEILGNRPPGNDTGGMAGSESGGSSGSGGLGGLGGQGEEASGGASGGAGGNSGTVGVLGESCAEAGLTACAGHAQKQRLICEGGEWSDNGSCLGDRYCNTAGEEPGSCQPIIPECEGKQAGDEAGTCEDDVPQVCGLDLVSLEDGPACENGEGCFAGVCESVAEICAGKEEGDPVAECVGNAPALCGPNLLTLVAGVECELDSACDAGQCKPIVPECAGKEEGDTVCTADGSGRFVCGPKLLVAEESEACDVGFCSAGQCGAPPSCAGFDGTCGAEGDGDCCEILPVTGGTFYRGFDMENPATISSFRLDKYEVTIGRFRKFIAATVGGWQPEAESGKHVHLNGGAGLAVGVGIFEPGWNELWNSSTYGLYSGATAKDSWDSVLSTGDQCAQSSWTSEPGANENRPVGCLEWHQAAAFCIWDGGFLPSDAEWEYAASGGSQELTFPWGAALPSVDRASYECALDGQAACSITEDLFDVGSLPDGDGAFGHSDLGGSMREWVLDWRLLYTYVPDCTDCANTEDATEGARTLRGGDWRSAADLLHSANRDGDVPDHGHEYIGVRCARPPLGPP